MSRFAANKAAMKLAEKAAKQADTARRRGEVQQKFAAMTEEERDAWRLARQGKRQDRRAETDQKRSKLQQVIIISSHAKTSPPLGPASSIVLYLVEVEGCLCSACSLDMRL